MKYMTCAVILTVSLVVLCGGVEGFVPPVSLLRPQNSALALKSLRGQLPPALRSGRSLTLQVSPAYDKVQRDILWVVWLDLQARVSQVKTRMVLCRHGSIKSRLVGGACRRAERWQGW